MTYHHYASLFPIGSPNEIAALASDIKKHGLIMPIVTLDDKILDGRSRFMACGIAGIPPIFQPYQGADALLFVVKQNRDSRHLWVGQRAMVASRLASMKAARDRGEGTANFLRPLEMPEICFAAPALKVLPSTVRRARFLQENGSAEMIEEVESGHENLGRFVQLHHIPTGPPKRFYSIRTSLTQFGRPWRQAGPA